MKLALWLLIRATVFLFFFFFFFFFIFGFRKFFPYLFMLFTFELDLASADCNAQFCTAVLLISRASSRAAGFSTLLTHGHLWSPSKLRWLLFLPAQSFPSI